MINLLSKLEVIILHKKTKKIAIWIMLILMVGSVIASILAYII